ncbi:ABC transporter ATP-binding protein [Clostridia bacterium OttesenSCG-928-F22]|nr:ABC transporter ATP-binding protein [Clostridia bacterium OttesenSCG-928-F22]
MSEPIIEVNDISMCFRMTKEKVDSLKEFVLRKIKRNLSYEEFYALNDISFTVERGELLGLVGLNGSGKSTLLKLIAGVMKPTKGSITVRGTIAPLIELGAGFDMDLTARENVYLNGAILGRTRKQMHEIFDSVIDFAELHEFLDVALKNYSSGMMARLGFALATAVEPDILLADEILSVGDFKFQQKCEERIAKMVEGGTTVILVSHNNEQIRETCQRAVWLKDGHMEGIGDAAEICDRYISQ